VTLCLPTIFTGGSRGPYDPKRVFHDVAADATHFGFVGITDPCLTITVCPDPDHTLFWDQEHPTEFGHAFFAVTVEASPAH